MSTITKEFTKEQLIEHLRSRIEHRKGLIASIHIDRGYRDYLQLELRSSEIALASLEADPVCVIDQSNLDYLKSGSDADVWPASRTEMGDVLLYRAAPPAPVAVPDEMTPKQASRAYCGEVRGYRDGWNVCRAAMLQGAEPVTTAYKLTDDFDFDRFNDVVWLEAIASNPHMHSLTTSTIAMVALELNKRMNVANSPAIPDGWVMVPVEPTEDMIVNGFESEPDESFSDEKEWEEYDAMSGCQQAAHRAKLCWSAMIAAAPQQEVNNDQ
ncbi:hypothetical protein [Enterobacter sp. yb_8]|uniref:hypothetical protein n=1 Tax=Enterobacter sp. yb_8 TaxID=3367221 RepID=UPI00370A7F03